MPKKGFTLIEVLLVVSILAILSIVSVALYTNMHNRAYDAKSKQDIDALASAYEIKKGLTNSYQALIDQDFASGSVPKSPKGDEYFNLLTNTGTEYKVCAALSNHSSNTCNTESPSCYCKTSLNAPLSDSIQLSQVSGQGLSIGGGFLTHPTSCDPTGVLDDGLVGYWRLDEGSGITTKDSSGFGNNGTLVENPTWTTGKNGGGIDFNGINSVDVPNNPTLQITGSTTITAWFKSTSYPGDDAPILSKRGGEDSYQLDVTADSGQRTIGFKLGNVPINTRHIRYGGTPLSLNTWYHVAGVYNAQAQTINVYLNGVEDNGTLINTVVSSQSSNNTDLRIGERKGLPDFNFRGIIDEVRLYNRAITPNEVTAIAGNCKP